MAFRMLAVVLTWLLAPGAFAESFARPLADGLDRSNSSNSSNKTNHTVWTCTVCAYQYNEHDGDGLDFEDLPPSWSCPICGQLKAVFTNGSTSAGRSDSRGGTGGRGGNPGGRGGASGDSSKSVWSCSVCMHEYDPAADGDGAAFEELPDEWTCPICGQPKSVYSREMTSPEAGNTNAPVVV